MRFAHSSWTMFMRISKRLERAKSETGNKGGDTLRFLIRLTQHGTAVLIGSFKVYNNLFTIIIYLYRCMETYYTIYVNYWLYIRIEVGFVAVGESIKYIYFVAPDREWLRNKLENENYTMRDSSKREYLYLPRGKLIFWIVKKKEEIKRGRPRFPSWTGFEKTGKTDVIYLI